MVINRRKKKKDKTQSEFSCIFKVFVAIPRDIVNYYYTTYSRECVRVGAAGAQTRRFLGHHLLHSLIFRLLVLCAPADFEAQSSLL